MAPAQPGLRHIGISLGNIGTLQDGLGEFALQMGRHIAAIAVQWRDERGIDFTFHLREKLFGVFGSDVSYLPVTRWQRVRHVQPRRFGLWHSLHQLNKTLPPQGTGVRLLTVHDLNYRHDKHALTVWRQGRRARALMRRTDHVVAISEYAAQDVRQHLGWTGPLDVIYRGPRKFEGVPQPVPGFEGHAERNRSFLFHLSRMSPSKNPQSILSLAAVWPEMDFLFCGPPTDEAQALRAAPQPANVHFAFSISEAQKAWAFAHCAGFIFPSLTEGFGLPPVEAMQWGKPVFLSRFTSLPEIGGDAAFYFDEYTPQAMRRVVEQGLREGAAPARAELVLQHAARFDWVRAADAYLALYLKLLGSSFEA